MLDVEELVAFFEVHRPQPVGAYLRKILQRRLLHLAPPRGKDQKIAVLEIRRGQDGRDIFARLDVDDVDCRRPASGAIVARHLPGPQPIDLALVAEEQNAVARVRGDDVLQRILFAQDLADDAASAAPLDAIRVGRHALYVPATADGDQDLLVVDQVFIADLAGEVGDDLGAARITKLALELSQLIPHEVRLASRSSR